MRLAEVPGGTRAAWAGRFLRDYPESRLFGRALESYVEAHASRHTPWLAAMALADLAAQPTHKGCRAALELAIGRVYADQLSRPDLALPHFEKVSREFPESPQWPDAEKRLALDLVALEEWPDAAARIARLEAKCPDFGWVRSGEAALQLGEAWERAGQWPKAEEAYVRGLTRHRDLEPVKDLSLLRRCFSRLSPASLDQIHAAAPDDLRQLLKDLGADQAADLVAKYPDLAKPDADAHQH